LLKRCVFNFTQGTLAGFFLDTNLTAKLATTRNEEEIKEYSVIEIAEYLSCRLGISCAASRQRVYRGLWKMSLHDRFDEQGKLVLADAVKIGGTWLIRRHAAFKYFVNSQG